MFKLIVITLLVNFNFILTDLTTSKDSLTYENASNESASSSYTLSSSSSSSQSSDIINNFSCHTQYDSEETKIPKIPEKPTTTPEQPTTTPEQPTTTPEQPTTTPNTSSSNAVDNFDKGNSKFTANFFYNVVKENPDKSVIMSPYSTLFLLALLGYFSIPPTENELLTPMNFKNKSEIPTTIPVILDIIKLQTKVNLTLTAKVYGNIKSNFSDRFKTESKKIIRADSENIDFTNAQKAADIINGWVANQTNNKIIDLIPANLLTPDTAMVLTNAFYFLGEWLNKFDKDSTTSSEFYTSDNRTIMVDTMNQVKNFKYAELADLNAQALELPYVNQNLTCLIILPKEIGGATRLVSKLVNEDALNSVRNSLQYERIAVSLPKFKTTTSIDLKDIFQKLNITTMFDPERSGLIGILADIQRIYVTAAIQKATIEVDETGSEAAAANAIIGVGITSVPASPIPFIANRSFIYYLLLRGTPIFCGLFAGK